MLHYIIPTEYRMLYYHKWHHSPSSTVGFVLDYQLGIPGSNPGWKRNRWLHFLSPNGHVHLTVNRYPEVNHIVVGLHSGKSLIRPSGGPGYKASMYTGINNKKKCKAWLNCSHSQQHCIYDTEICYSNAARTNCTWFALETQDVTLRSIPGLWYYLVNLIMEQDWPMSHCLV